MSYRLIQRFDPPHCVKVTPFDDFDEAVWAARACDTDYVIERPACGVAPAMPVKYRLGEFEMG